MSVKWIFSINPGRSGSDYASHLFKHAKDCLSLHESAPVMCGEVMVWFVSCLKLNTNKKVLARV